LIARSWKFGTMSFGSPTDSARMNTENVLNECVSQVAISNFPMAEAYYIWMIDWGSPTDEKAWLH
jgi:hypothetical protein